MNESREHNVERQKPVTKYNSFYASAKAYKVNIVNTILMKMRDAKFRITATFYLEKTEKKGI